MVASGLAALGALAAAVVVLGPLFDGPSAQSANTDKVIQGADSQASDRLAEAALNGDPLNARIVRDLGIRADKAGQAARAAQLFNVAGELSRRDLQSQAWLFEHEVEAGRFASGLLHADAMLRTDPEFKNLLFPAFAKLATNSDAAKALAGRMASNPFWREPFLEFLIGNDDPSLTFNLLDQLSRSKSPPTQDEISLYTSRLMQLGRYNEALLGMFLFTPSARLKNFDGIYDGAFDGVPGPRPFTWTIVGGVGSSVDIEPGPERPNNSALHITYDGFSNPQLISQDLILAPGPYTLTMEAYADTPVGVSQLEWTLKCFKTDVVLFHRPIQASQSWLTYSIPFDVPDADCGAQILSLVPVPGSRRVNISLWYDRLSLARRSAS